MSDKHDAAKRLLAAAEKMRDLLTEQTDGTHIWQMIRTVVLNARVFEALTRPYLPEPEDDGEEDGEEDSEGDT